MGDSFTTTRWSIIIAAAGVGSRATAELEYLCKTSWQPLYAFARRSGLSPHDSEDAVQGFLSDFIQSGSLARANKEKGRFRTFLLNAMKYHMSDEYDKRKAQKRGGGLEHIALDAEENFLQIASQEQSPEQAFDKAWSLGIIERAKKKLEQECEASGKHPLFLAFFSETAEGSAENYHELGKKLGMNEATLRSHALRLRKRWGELIRSEILDTVNNNDALAEELESLRQALAAK